MVDSDDFPNGAAEASNKNWAGNEDLGMILISFVYYSSRTEDSYAIRTLTFELCYDMKLLGF